MKMTNCLRRLCCSPGRPNAQSSPLAHSSQPEGDAKENAETKLARPIAQDPDPAQNIQERAEEKALDCEGRAEEKAQLVWVERERCFRPSAEDSTSDVHKCNSLMCLSCRSRSCIRFIKATGHTPKKQCKPEAERTRRERAANAPAPPEPIIENISSVGANRAYGWGYQNDAVPFDRTESLSEDSVLHFIESIENAGDESRACDARGRSDEGPPDRTGPRPDDESVLRFIESIENGTGGRGRKNEGRSGPGFDGSGPEIGT